MTINLRKSIFLSLRRMEECMSKISIRECVRISLQPDNYSMDLAECTDQGVVDKKVDHHRSYEQTEGYVETVDPSYQLPG